VAIGVLSTENTYNCFTVRGYASQKAEN